MTKFSLTTNEWRQLIINNAADLHGFAQNKEAISEAETVAALAAIDRIKTMILSWRSSVKVAIQEPPALDAAANEDAQKELDVDVPNKNPPRRRVAK